MERKKRILVIAGSDSSGGAGTEADQKVIAAHGCYAMTATTALTAQNTEGVIDIHYIPAKFVEKQINACIDDIGVDVIKIGMLAQAETVDVAAEVLRRLTSTVSVVDPVMVSTSGSKLLPEKAIRNLREQLLPITTILTPNISEALLLLRDSGTTIPDPQSLDDLVNIAKTVHGLGPKFVLVKGGHLPMTRDRKVPVNDADKSIVTDVLYNGSQVSILETEYLVSRSTHGTGCSLASAIASNIALGDDVPYAVRKACRYVEAGIKGAINLGRGHGPINHFHSTYMLPFTPGHFIDYLLDRSDVGRVWKQHTEHQFVQQMADGTLPIENFKYYLIQDYLFLVQFARAKALGAYKRKSISDTAEAASEILHIEQEMALHLGYCASFGLSKSDVESHKPSQACLAYTCYILDIGHSEDWLALQVGLAPCLIGYGMIAQRLFTDPKTIRGPENRYWQWIENYVADDYVAAVSVGKGVSALSVGLFQRVEVLAETLERHATLQSPSRIEELVTIFISATELETGFWNMGYKRIV